MLEILRCRFLVGCTFLGVDGNDAAQTKKGQTDEIRSDVSNFPFGGALRTRGAVASRKCTEMF